MNPSAGLKNLKTSILLRNIINHFDPLANDAKGEKKRTLCCIFAQFPLHQASLYIRKEAGRAGEGVKREAALPRTLLVLSCELTARLCKRVSAFGTNHEVTDPRFC